MILLNYIQKHDNKIIVILSQLNYLCSENKQAE